MREYLYPNWPAPNNVLAVCTTRKGGASLPPFDSFNLGQFVGDDAHSVQKNRSLLLQDLQLEQAPRWLKQVHSNIVVHSQDMQALPEADGIVSDQANIPCAVLTGDCLPVLLCDTKGTKVAAIHGGWRGLAGGILARGVSQMDTPGDELLAWLGPAIGPQRFEVGPEVAQVFIDIDKTYQSAFKEQTNGKFLGNLFEIARIQLSCAGVEAVYSDELCTVSDSRFYSYRRDQGKTGRMASIIWLD